MTRKVNALNERELAWVGEQVQNAVRFVEAFSAQDAGKPLTLAGLDRAFAKWIASQPDIDSGLINTIINAVGIAFGQFLAKDNGLNWVIASDENGTELALYGLPGKGDVLIYPANLVAKRWERKEVNFLQTVYKEVADQIRAISHNSDRCI